MSDVTEWLKHLKDQRKGLESFLNEEYFGDNNQTTGGSIFPKELKAKHLKELRVACIMDSFTLNSYRPECNLIELTPQNWKEEIESFQPELIFIESAWRGKDELWNRKISHGSAELYRLTAYCHEKGVPIVFWNKEDPIHTKSFMFAAKCADFVFTTDIDCIKIYKRTLRHDNVYFLHFAAQPQLHNPIEKYNRKDKFCFAGSYYPQYLERCKVLETFTKVFGKLKGFDIYDRNYGSKEQKNVFPDSYSPYILGTLDPKEIDIAYKGYYYGINMNTVDQSRTMFARRVFEMLASNTVTVGNYSLGEKNLFGDLAICTNSEQTLEHDLANRCNTLENLKKYRLLGLRKVLSEHLYEDRLEYVVQKVFGVSLKSQPPIVMCVAAPSPQNLAHILDMFKKQTYQNKKLLLVGEFPSVKENGVIQIRPESTDSTLVGEILSEGYIGLLKDNNYYGENYLIDLALTLRYISAPGVGKAGYYVCRDGAYDLVSEDKVYRCVKELQTDRSIFTIDKYGEFTVADFLKLETLSDESFFSIDEFQFCQGLVDDFCPMVDDMVLPNQGVSIFEIEREAEGIAADSNQDVYTVPMCDLLRACYNIKDPSVQFSIHDGHIRFNSTIEDEKPRYVWLNNFYEVKKFQKGGNMRGQAIGMGDLVIRVFFAFFDVKKNKIGQSFFLILNRFDSCEIPEGAEYFRVGVRFIGKGVCDIRKILVGLEKD